MTSEDKLRLTYLAKQTGLSKTRLQSLALARLYQAYCQGQWHPDTACLSEMRVFSSRGNYPNTHGRGCTCSLCQKLKGDTL